ncbi:MAG TPA: hypothetical protein VFO76_08265 [Candidatus Kapabacteria bacterium]|nr:hypothetical protein [Candidatus Kapabacteria bacterium]
MATLKELATKLDYFLSQNSAGLRCPICQNRDFTARRVHFPQEGSDGKPVDKILLHERCNKCGNILTFDSDTIEAMPAVPEGYKSEEIDPNAPLVEKK